MNRQKLTLAALSVLALVGCGKKDMDKGQERPSVEIMTVQTSTVGLETTYPGTVEAMNGTALSLSTGGTLLQLNISEGQMVRRGQLIAVVDGSSQGYALTASEAQVQQARDAYAQAQDYYDRMKMLHENGSLPDVRWIEARTRLKQAAAGMRAAQANANISHKQLRDTRLYAPFTGYVSQKLAEVGQHVAPGMSVATLMRIDQVKVKVSIPEQEISKIHSGQLVHVYVDALDGSTFMGKVVEKGVSADPATRSYDVKVLVDNPHHALLPGMVCRATTRTGMAGAYAVVPADIIQMDADNRAFVWTIRGGKAHKTPIVLGENLANGVAVKGGLMAGDQVITEGQLSVCEGSQVEIRKNR